MANSKLKKDKIFNKFGIDALFISKSVNASYLTGSGISECFVLLTRNKDYFFTDPRFEEEAKKTIKNFKVLITKDNIYASLGEILKGKKQIGFESDSLSYGHYLKLKKALPAAKLIPTKAAIEELRIVKTKKETELIKKSASIAVDSFKEVKKCLKAGRSENEICALLEYAMKRHGATASSFPTIVASGPNSSRPHAIASIRKIKRNDIILMDFGADLDGYKSDLTRVIFLGKINSLFGKIYDIVFQAQQRAIEAVRPGVKASEIDKIAREVISAKGYGKYFLHATGHGIGREVHERPNISIKSQDILQPGMIFTVEPALYFPGKFGIRIEDMILVTQKNYEVLTR